MIILANVFAIICGIVGASTIGIFLSDTMHLVPVWYEHGWRVAYEIYLMDQGNKISWKLEKSVKISGGKIEEDHYGD